jgi:hypothetical protein
MLLDSGASCSFIDERFVRRAGLDQTALAHPVTVTTANGQSMSCTRMIAEAIVAVHGHTHDLVVIPHLDAFEVILGRTFLKRSRATVCHATDKVTWPSNQVRRSANFVTSNPWAVLDDQSLDTNDSDNDDQHRHHVSPDAGMVAKRSAKTARRATSTHQFNAAPRSARRAETDRSSNEPAVSAPCTQPVPKPSSKPVEPQAQHEFTQAHLQALERIMARVDVYAIRMKPSDGCLPPSRGEFDHKIELRDPASSPVKSRAMPLNAEERAQLAVDIKELLDAGLIERSESEWGSPAFYVSKDGGLARRLVIDYRALNRLLKRKAMSLPHIDELMARLGKAKFFTKIDLRSSYHQVLVRPEDRHMTAFVTPIGHFQWRVLPFGECNAPATFVEMMRHLVLHDMTSRDVMDFVDDILVYSETAEQHERDVNDVLERLEKHGLFIKPSKCQWMVSQVDFLGFTVTATDAGTTITPTHSKIAAVDEWPVPRTQTQMRSFLGFANTFRSFINGFSRIAAPLFDLLKQLKNKRTAPLRWNDAAHLAFVELKDAIADSATLGVADASKPFIVHTDASDYAVGAVLSQYNQLGELRPIGFMSQKLTDVEYRWSVYEKELCSIVVALKRWSMHLMYTQHPVEVHNDHASLRFLLDQPKLSAKQTRWLAFLSTFSDLRFVHVRGTENARADALSRRADHDVGLAQRQQIRSDVAKQQFAEAFGRLGLPNARINMLVSEVSAGNVEIAEQIVAGYQKDDKCRRLLTDPERAGYRLRWDCLERISDGSILVPDDHVLRSRILRCIHDAPVSGHLGVQKTYDRLIPSFHWPNAWIDVADYIRSCDTCQRVKRRMGETPGLHQPSQIAPEAHTIAIDFLGPLSRTPRGKDSVLVILDTFTKRAFLEPVSSSITAEQTAHIIVNRVIRHQGVPRAIRSDRDSRFTSEVWQEIWRLMGVDLELTTAHHHQSNGMPERFMQTLTSALRSYCNERGSDWDNQLAMIELAYNTSTHSTTGMSPIEIDIGITPRLPISLARSETDASASAAFILEQISENEMSAFRAILASQHRDKTRIDDHRQDELYEIGDKVWLDTKDLFVMNQPGSRKLRPRWAGPFEVVAVHGDLNVELKLPAQWRIHPIIHIARLKRAHERDELRFTDDESVEDSHSVIDDDGSDNLSAMQHAHTIEHEVVTDLSDYDERGAAVAQVERELMQPSRARTRAAVQRAHDKGERYDYVQL